MTQTAYEKALFDAIKALVVPVESLPLQESSLDTHILYQDSGDVVVTLTIPTSDPSPYKPLVSHIESHLSALSFVHSVRVILTSTQPQDAPPKKPRETPSLAIPPGIKRMIAVVSGKGGVGKSTVSALLAQALQQTGQRVGLLDADIYGPSLPRMTGAYDRPVSKDGKTWEPILKDGISLMSIGSLIQDQGPAMWRGPMIQTAFMQLLCQVNWGNLDTLVIDTPPGTGDISLGLIQKVPIGGVVFVSTPQRVAWDDTLKSVKLFEKFHIPILGLLLNMTPWVCSQCDHENDVPNIGELTHDIEQHLPILGHIPFTRQIQTACEHGDSLCRTLTPDSMTAAAQILTNKLNPTTKES